MRKFLIPIFALFLVGCSFKPELPKINTSFEYEFKTSQISDRWWQEFGDEKLNLLVEDALKNNTDLKIAYANLEQSALSLKNSKADLFPTLNLNTSATKRQASGETFGSIDNSKYNDFSISAVLNYEIDLWGRVRNSVASADALFEASKYDYNTSKLSIVSNVVSSYFTLVSLKMQEAVYEDTLKTYEESLNYRKNQLDAGSITKIVYLQSVASVQSAKIGLDNVRNSIVSASNALSILTGKSNNEILYGTIDTNLILPNAPQISANISSDILLKRSDVASAYEALKSSNALIGVARASYFPTISLTGIFGFGSDELDKLFIQNANVWSLAGSLTQSVFDYGKRANNVEIAKLIQTKSALKYESAVKTALAEVRTALENRKNAVKILEQTNHLLKSQNEIYDIAKAQYDTGYLDHLDLLDAQRNLLNTRISYINAKLGLNNAVLDVFRAFGGGFEVQE